MDNVKKRPLVRFRRSAILYALLLVFALIFTQALRATASAVLFWFLVLLPILSLIYVLVGKALIRIYVSSDITKVEKLQPMNYELRIINASPFAYPFIEAVVSVPQPDGVRCTEQSLTMSLPPMGSYIVNHETSFRYRGNYEIGVRCLYISDFLGLFSIRLDVDIYQNVMVFPRKLGMDMKMATSATDIPNDAAKLVFSTEKAEISNIREYVPGDSLKSIHWKLSSKAVDGSLMVKDFNTNTSQSVYMLCDFSRAIPPEVFEDEANEIKERAVSFLKEIFRVMEEEIEIDTDFNYQDNELSVSLSGGDMGVMIGKRGQTLDSLQYLVSLVVNKHRDVYIRVKLDTENYRERREQKLKSLARNIAHKVKRTRRSVALEPMNPYERRIIHSTLQNNRYVETYSEGEEPFRKVVIAPKKHY